MYQSFKGEIIQNKKSFVQTYKQVLHSVKNKTQISRFKKLFTGYTGWIMLATEDKDSCEFQQSVGNFNQYFKKYQNRQSLLRQMSIGNGWCTGRGMQEVYLKQGDFWLYLDNGQAKIAIRTDNLMDDNGQQHQIQGRFNVNKNAYAYAQQVIELANKYPQIGVQQYGDDQQEDIEGNNTSYHTLVKSYKIQQNINKSNDVRAITQQTLPYLSTQIVKKYSNDQYFKKLISQYSIKVLRKDSFDQFQDATLNDLTNTYPFLKEDPDFIQTTSQMFLKCLQEYDMQPQVALKDPYAKLAISSNKLVQQKMREVIMNAVVKQNKHFLSKFNKQFQPIDVQAIRNNPRCIQIAKQHFLQSILSCDDEQVKQLFKQFGMDLISALSTPQAIEVANNWCRTYLQRDAQSKFNYINKYFDNRFSYLLKDQDVTVKREQARKIAFQQQVKAAKDSAIQALVSINIFQFNIINKKYNNIFNNLKSDPQCLKYARKTFIVQSTLNVDHAKRLNQFFDNTLADQETVKKIVSKLCETNTINNIHNWSKSVNSFGLPYIQQIKARILPSVHATIESGLLDYAVCLQKSIPTLRFAQGQFVQSIMKGIQNLREQHDLWSLQRYSEMFPQLRTMPQMIQAIKYAKQPARQTTQPVPAPVQASFNWYKRAQVQKTINKHYFSDNPEQLGYKDIGHRHCDNFYNENDQPIMQTPEGYHQYLYVWSETQGLNIRQSTAANGQHTHIQIFKDMNAQMHRARKNNVPSKLQGCIFTGRVQTYQGQTKVSVTSSPKTCIQNKQVKERFKNDIIKQFGPTEFHL